MKQLLLPLTFASLMMLSSAPAHAVSEIVLDHVTDLYNGDTVNAGCLAQFTFRLTNTDGNTITGFTNGFRVWTHKYGAYTDNFSAIIYDTLSLGWRNMFDLVFYINPFSVNGLGVDTVGFGGAKLMGSGIADGTDTLVWWIATVPSQDGDTLCIDSSFFPPGGAWVWATPGGVVYPSWSGPHCFHVSLCPCGVPQFTNCVSSLNFPHCDTAQYTFCAEDVYICHYLDFNLISGPGTITEISDTCAMWSYVPSLADVGTSQSITVEVRDLCNCGLCVVDLNFTNNAPIFTDGCYDTVTVSPGHNVNHQMSIDTIDCDPVTVFIASVNPVPYGSYSFDSTGLITFDTHPLDDGIYAFNICVTDSIDTTCCPVYFYVTDTCCQVRGNADGQSGINVADLIYLVSYLFDGGLAPPCYEEGNVDGVGGINVADLTYLVDYLFFGGAAPPPCP